MTHQLLIQASPLADMPAPTPHLTLLRHTVTFYSPERLWVHSPLHLWARLLWATVHSVPASQTQPKRLSTHAGLALECFSAPFLYQHISLVFKSPPCLHFEITLLAELQINLLTGLSAPSPPHWSRFFQMI